MDKNIIASLMNKKNKISFTLDEIIKLLDIKGSKDLKELKNSLTRLIATGEIFHDYNNDTYMLFENSNMHKGILKLDDKKRYYIDDNGSKIIINNDNLHHASYGDFVIVEYNFKKRKYEINKVLRKDNNNYVAEVINENNTLYVYNDKIGKLEIDNKTDNLLEGSIVLITKNNDKASIKEIICHKDDANAKILRVVYEHGFTNEFTDEVKEELKTIPSKLEEYVITRELAKGRVDLRDKDIVTIDCDSTKDIDDAVYIEKNKNGTVSLYVCIANVSEYIDDSSHLSTRIKQSGTSVYPPGCVIPMLPRELSNGICSLNPNVDRLAVCFKSTFDNNGKLVDFDIFKAIINSKKKMTYSDVDKILEDNIMVDGYQKFHKQLLEMQRLYLLIEKDFYNNGYLEFKSPELNFILDDNSNIETINKNIQGTGAKIIEFFMLATNKNACEYFSKLGIPLVYRIDSKPNFRKISDVIEILQNKNYLGNRVNSFEDDKDIEYTKEELQSVLGEIDQTLMPEVFYRMLIKTMSKAKFSVKNIGHYPLGLEYYAQFTSPIRRAGDWRNHTILDYYLETKDSSEVRKRFPIGSLIRETEVYSEREREAESVEAEVNQMLLLEYLANHFDDISNKSLIGRISNIAPSTRVLLDSGIKGKIILPTDSIMIVDNDLLLGSNLICSIGDLVSVKLSGVNFKTKEILFTLEKNLEKEYNLNEKKEKVQKNEKKVKIRQHIYST